jgi:hypothetical protein
VLESFFSQVAIACAMVLITTAIHGSGTFVVLKALHWNRRHRWIATSYLRKVNLVAGAALVMFLASLLEMGLWAWVYLQLGALADPEIAGYFSAVTFVSLGYGDVTLHPPWRLLSALEGANGVILFGWSTAVVFAAVREVVIEAGSGAGMLE